MKWLRPKTYTKGRSGPGADGLTHLLRLNSEFAAYVPPHRQRPDIQLRETGDPDYFPPGAKHRYTRG
ncbi:hypothetical protein ACBR40_45845 [Nonomuraea sp. AD125B]|uniref:hypothetical protein n=1 Tax=Nonomuraea sp. AD125B TaxID=3242897 RepID=UPI0035283920